MHAAATLEGELRPIGRPVRLVVEDAHSGLRQLDAFVRGGGGLLISGGDQVARSLQSLSPLLPVVLPRLRKLKEGPEDLES